MTVNIVTGDLFSKNYEVLVNPVNCFAVSGDGLAKEFAKKYPGNQKALKKFVLDGEPGMKPGRCFGYQRGLQKNSFPKFIINFATKDHWRHRSELAAIENGLKALRKFIIREEVESVAIPALGCGLGRLEWRFVRNLIRGALADLDCRIDLYKPHQ